MTIDSPQVLNALESIFPGHSELAKLMRGLDWSETDLPSPEQWPEELRISVRLCLTSKIPIVMYWGPKFTMLYNDAYISFMGNKKHPYYLGKPCEECWSEIWETIGPMLNSVYESSEATWSKDIKMFFDRRLPLEEVFVRFTFGPILAADGKTVMGIFCPCTETTEQFIGARRLETLRKLSIRSSEIETVKSVCDHATKVITENLEDLPFAALYILDENKDEIIATLDSVAGLINSSNIPQSIVLSDKGASFVESASPLSKPIRSVFNNPLPQIISNLSSLGINLPSGPWAEPVQQAIILPIPSTNKEKIPSGIILLGISPNRVLDDSYRSFFNLVTRHIGTAINDVKAHEAERRRAEDLAELDRAKTQFFSNISHEFRTPLTLMLGPIQDALEIADPSLRGENLSIVNRNALRLLKLVNTLLDFSRIESGRIQGSFESINISEFTIDLASNFRSAIERAGLKFNVHCEPISKSVYVDPEMWEKIVLNLLSNAFKFTFEGAITVTLKAINNSNAIEFSVQDTGTGIARIELPRIFERFNRIEGAKGRTHEGSGIGLALIQDLVKIHSGEIQVTSELGKGSTFTVIVPTGHQHLPAEQISNKGTSDSTSGSNVDYHVKEALSWLPECSNLNEELRTLSSDARILIADDNADMRNYLAHLLSKHWTVQTACDGESALAMLQHASAQGNLSFDLLLTDVMMPGIDGFQLLHSVKKDPNINKIAVIIISARAGEDSRIEGLQAGADDYLVKPFSARELITRVGTQIELSKQRKALIAELNTMTLLRNITTRFVQGNDLSMIFTEIVDAAISITDADKGNMLLLDEENGVFKFVAQRGFQQPFLDYYTSNSKKEALFKLLERDNRILVEDVTKSSHCVETANLNLLLTENIRAFQTTLLRSRSGKVVGILSTHHVKPRLPSERALQMIDLLARLSADLIERGQWLQERAQLLQKLQDVDRRRNDYLAILSHELRNPLAAISHSTFMLSYMNSESSIAQRVKNTIERQVQQITRLVNDLLDIARIKHNKIHLQLQQVNLNTIAHHTIEDSRTIFNQSDILLYENLAKTPVIIDADPARITQIISNLLQNAAKFSVPGGITQISVGIEENKAVIRVKDNGIGIEPEIQKELFEPFIQEDRTLVRSGGGLGLGLSLVKTLIELHQGTVEVQSKGKGFGAEFIIKLPLAKKIKDKVIEPTIDTAKHSMSKNVLIIEDNLSVAESLKDVIEVFGHQAYLASSGPEGIATLWEMKIDIVLCDLGLPYMDGYEVAKIIKSDEKLSSIFLIALSGYASNQDIEKALSAGFNVHLAKPPNLNTLEELLQSELPA